MQIVTPSELANCSDDEFAAKLVSFTEWNGERGDCAAWNDVFNRFEGILKAAHSRAVDDSAPVQLSPSDLPMIQQVIRVSDLIVSNVHNSHLYGSLEHLQWLLQTDDIDMCLNILRIITAVARKSSSVFNERKELKKRVHTLAWGFGPREDALGMLAVASSAHAATLPASGSTLHFEFNVSSTPTEFRRTVIHIPNFATMAQNPHAAYAELVQTYNVPVESRFALFVKIVQALSFLSLDRRRQVVRVQLRALTVLAYLHTDPAMLSPVLSARPDLQSELIELVGAEESVPVDIRAISMRTLQTFGLDKSRLHQSLHLFGTVDQSRLLPTLIRRAANALAQDQQAPDSPFAPVFTESLLSYLTVAGASTSGAQALTSGGIIPSLVQILGIQRPQVLNVMTTVLRLIELISDRAATAVPLFIELGGLELLTARLESAAASLNGTAVDSANRVYLKVLFRTILATIAPNFGSTIPPAVRHAMTGPLPQALRLFYEHAEDVGGTVLSLAASCLGSLAQADPLTIPQLVETGAPRALLLRMQSGFPMHATALISVPPVIAHLCLKQEGTDLVTELRAVPSILRFLTRLDASSCLHGDTGGLLGGGLEELLRHVPSLRGQFVEGVKEMFEGLVESDAQRAIDLAAAPPADGKDDKVISQLIVAIGKLLESTFQRAENVEAFVNAGGPKWVLNLHNLKTLPPQFAHTQPAYWLSVSLRACAATMPKEVVGAVLSALYTLRSELSPTALVEGVRSSEVLSAELTKQLSALDFLCGVLGHLLRAAQLGEWPADQFPVLYETLGRLHRFVILEVTKYRVEHKAEIVEPMDVTNAPSEAAPFPGGSPMEDIVADVAEEKEVADGEAKTVAASAPLPPKYALLQRIASTLSSAHVGMGRAIVAPRRNAPRETRQMLPENSHAFAVMLTDVLIEALLNPPEQADLRVRYYKQMIGELRSVLFDRRKDQLNTMLMVVFESKRGFQVLHEATNWLVDAANDPALQEASAVTAIKEALTRLMSLLGRCVDEVRYADSTVTASMMRYGGLDPTILLNAVREHVGGIILPLFRAGKLNRLPVTALTYTLPAVHVLLNVVYTEPPPRRAATTAPAAPVMGDEGDDDEEEALARALAMSMEGGENAGADLMEEAPAAVVPSAAASDPLLPARTISSLEDVKSPELELAAFGDVAAICAEMLRADPQNAKNVSLILADLCQFDVQKRPALIEHLLSLIPLQPQQALETLCYICNDSVECRIAVIALRGVSVIINVLGLPDADADVSVHAMDLLSALCEVPLSPTGELITATGPAGTPLILPSLLSPAEQLEVLEASMRALGHEKMSVAHSALIVMSLLARNFENSVEFVKRGGVARVLALARRKAVDLEVAIAIRVCIRRLVEDVSSLQALVSVDIAAAFAQAAGGRQTQTAQVLVQTFAGQLSRSPAIFLKAMTSLCVLNNDRHQSIALKNKQAPPATPAPAQASAGTAETPATTTTMSADTTTPAPPAGATPKLDAINAAVAELDAKCKHRNTAGTVVSELVNALNEIELPVTAPADKSEEPSVQSIVSLLLSVLDDVVSTNQSGSVPVILRGPQGKHHETDASLQLLLRRLLPWAAISGTDETRSQVFRMAVKIVVALCGRQEGRTKVLRLLAGSLRTTAPSSGTGDDIHRRTLHACSAVLCDLLQRVQRSHSPELVAQLQQQEDIIPVLLGALGQLDLDNPASADTANVTLRALQALITVGPPPERPALAAAAPANVVPSTAASVLPAPADENILAPASDDSDTAEDEDGDDDEGDTGNHGVMGVIDHVLDHVMAQEGSDSDNSDEDDGHEDGDEEDDVHEAMAHHLHDDDSDSDTGSDDGDDDDDMGEDDEDPDAENEDEDAEGHVIATGDGRQLTIELNADADPAAIMNQMMATLQQAVRDRAGGADDADDADDDDGDEEEDDDEGEEEDGEDGEDDVEGDSSEDEEPHTAGSDMEEEDSDDAPSGWIVADDDNEEPGRPDQLGFLERLRAGLLAGGEDTRVFMQRDGGALIPLEMGVINRRRPPHRWTDDGSAPDQRFVDFAKRYESILAEALRELRPKGATPAFAPGAPRVSGARTAAAPQMRLRPDMDLGTMLSLLGGLNTQDAESAPTPSGALTTPPVPQQPPMRVVSPAITLPAMVPPQQRSAAQPPPSQPAAAQPPPTQPAAAQPPPTQPAATQPAAAQPAAAQPAQATEPTTSNEPPEGIDKEFWDALPEELRQEIRDQQAPPAARQVPVAEDIDPEFLAALPPELQAEVIADARRERRRREERQQREAARAAGVDTAPTTTAAPAAPADPIADTLAFLATLTPDLRADALSQLDETLLAQLPDNIQQEAARTRERMHMQRMAYPPGGMSQLLRTFLPPGERYRMAAMAPGGRPGIPAEAKGKAVVNADGISALVRLLRMVHPLTKGLLAKVLLHLCNHPETRKLIIDHLFNMLNEGVVESTTSVVTSTSTAAGGLREAALANANARSTAASPSIVSRRVLEMLLHMAQTSARVACMILGTKLEDKKPKQDKPDAEAGAAPAEPGKPAEAVVEAKPTEPKEVPVVVTDAPVLHLLSLLPRPLYVRSNAHSDYLLALLAVVVGLPNPRLGPDQELETSPTLPAELLANVVGVLKREDSTLQAAERAMLVAKRLSSNADNAAALLRVILDGIRQCQAGVVYRLAAGTTTVIAADADQVLLRLLRSLSAVGPKAHQPQVVASICDELESLWEPLSRNLSSLPSSKLDDAGSLLPLISAFFEASSIQRELAERDGIDTMALARLPSVSSASGDDKFSHFVQLHRALLNAIVRQNPTLLEGAFGMLTKLRGALDFDNKRAWFRGQVRKRRDRTGQEMRLMVRRNHVFEDSFASMRHQDKEELKGKLTIVFQGEEGVDAGGLTREWYLILSREMFNPGYALFTTSESKTFQPNHQSWVNPEHLAYFKFVGQIVGKALLEGYLLDAHFTRALYKHMLGVTVRPSDLAAADPDYYKQLMWMLDNDIEGVLDLTFSAELDVFGKTNVVELKPGGASIVVDNANKQEYVQLMCEMKMTESVKSQLDAFLAGFHDLVPHDMIAIFTETELELLISGLPDIDIGDLRANTDYTGYSSTAPVIRWFWEVIETLNSEQRAHLLQFVTGTSKVPLDGFKALRGMSGPQKFSIHKAYGGDDRLPTAHTCFNQLDLPEYTSREVLRQRLLVSIDEGHTGFGFS
eukprot:TRINITY_DN406_c0_g1_i1.p1 TRINITY_DN406_c0_g1~~TRINITY_DN406_c0_g1_i1.p1  ORF type:complete len:3198 (-),score=960.76 TRINITY_DN406_c0_g1_i1:108-9701(-)